MVSIVLKIILQTVLNYRGLNLKLIVTFSSVFSCHETPGENLDLYVGYFPDFFTEC